jgi:hypothetical protein
MWQSTGMWPRRLRVRPPSLTPAFAPRHAAVAQRQEQRIPNPPVEGSSPSSRANHSHPTSAGSSVDKSGSLRNSVTRRFKSCSAHSYRWFVGAVGSAPPCQGGGHGFEPRTDRKGRSRAAGRCWPVAVDVNVPLGERPANHTHSEVAQWAEQAVVTRQVEGSTPSLGAHTTRPAGRGGSMRPAATREIPVRLGCGPQQRRTKSVMPVSGWRRLPRRGGRGRSWAGRQRRLPVPVRPCRRPRLRRTACRARRTR